MKDLLIDTMHKWGTKYPNAGYGGRFYEWLLYEEREPYNSWGNGSAMRVSPAGWFGRDLESVRRLARWSAEVTHNHPDEILAEGLARIPEDLKKVVVREIFPFVVPIG